MNYYYSFFTKIYKTTRNEQVIRHAQIEGRFNEHGDVILIIFIELQNINLWCGFNFIIFADFNFKNSSMSIGCVINAMFWQFYDEWDMPPTERLVKI